MNDLDMDFLLGSEDDDGSSRRRSGGPSRSARSRSRRRRRRQKRKGALASVIALVVVVGVLGGGGYFGYQWVRDAMVPDDYTGPGTGEVIIEIKSGDSATDVAQRLEEQGVVKSVRAFINAIGAAGKSASLQPGSYKLRKEMAAEHAVAALDPELRLRTKITIREGLRLSQILEQLSTATGKPVAEFQKAAKDAEALGLPGYARKRLEGFAFPATYELSPQMSPADILAAMVDRYKQAAEEHGLEQGAKSLGFTPYQILTVASIVQAESGSQADMAKVARVIYNRLALQPPMKLQMDSTVMYALGKYGIAATNAELETKSRYNTYRYHGLPPGPIGNPGDHAIEAALKPAKGNWLFFVTTDPKRGITKFTDSETEFYKFRAEFNRNQRGG